MARPRKPDFLKIVAGTAQKCRMNPMAPTGAPVVLTAPDWLPARAREIFADLAAVVADMGVSLASDQTALALLAARLYEIERTTAVIEDLGHVYATTNAAGERVMKRRPEVAMRSEAMRHAQSLLHEFGLTPAARSRVSVSRTPGANPFASL